jgi:hypothetical protein
MSKRVMIFLVVGIIIVIAAFFVHKYEIEKDLEVEDLPEVKPRKPKQPAQPLEVVKENTEEVTGKLDNNDQQII